MTVLKAVQRRSVRCDDRERGFTVVELAVVAGVLTLLMALIIPAVQAGRAASRRLACSSRLRQLALAASIYETSHGTFADGNRVFRSLVPSLEYELPSWDYIGDLAGPETLLCPSDELAVRVPAMNSYKICLGDSATSGGVFDGYDQVASPSEILDGLSSTVLFAERAITFGDFDGLSGTAARPGNPMGSPVRYNWWVSRHANSQADRIELCLSERTAVTPLYILPTARLSNVAEEFTTALPPNTPGCFGSAAGDVRGTEVYSRFQTATGFHPGFVNAAMCDGSVRAVPESISLNVWRAAGTIAGGEAAGAFE